MLAKAAGEILKRAPQYLAIAPVFALAMAANASVVKADNLSPLARAEALAQWTYDSMVFCQKFTPEAGCGNQQNLAFLAAKIHAEMVLKTVQGIRGHSPQTRSPSPQ